VAVPSVLSETTQLIQQCTSCGPECESSCGSRNFRTCCYNYLKKRSGAPSITPSSALRREPLLGSDFPWLTALVDGSSPRNSPVLASDRDLKVELLLLPDWSPETFNRYRNYVPNYQVSLETGFYIGNGNTSLCRRLPILQYAGAQVWFVTTVMNPIPHAETQRSEFGRLQS